MVKIYCMGWESVIRGKLFMKSIITKINTKKISIHGMNISFASLLVLSASLALSQEKTYVAPDVNIIYTRDSDVFLELKI